MSGLSVGRAFARNATFEVAVLGFKRIVAAAIALALVVGALGVFLVFTQVATLGRALAWVDHTRTVIQTDQRLTASIEEAEDAERGFLITGDERYLGPYRDAAGTIPADLARLRALVVDNPRRMRQVEGLAAAIERRRAIVDETISAARAKGLPAARAMVADGAG
ncbi:MAG: CHASE3 domain-containing protein, partial [Caulobacteraceae bacterium]